MTNPYAPPNAPLEGDSAHDKHSAQYKQAKSAVRPFGVVAVVTLFFVFSVVDVVALFADGDNWWIVSVGITGLLAYWFRNLWWGDERERKIAVFLGFFCAGLLLLGISHEPIRTWPPREFAELAEGCYFLCAASYLVYARRNPFFENSAAP